MKKIRNKTQELDEANNQEVNSNTPQDQDIEMEILLQLQQKKDEYNALKKMIDNLNQLQKNNKSRKSKK
ncbi:MAG: hypothetical protein AB9846_13650 [Tenuifilaceae bacterium]